MKIEPMKKMRKEVFKRKLSRLHEDFGVWYGEESQEWPQQKKWLKKYICENFLLSEERVNCIFKVFHYITNQEDNLTGWEISQGQLLNNLIEIAIYGLPDKDETGW